MLKNLSFSDNLKYNAGVPHTHSNAHKTIIIFFCNWEIIMRNQLEVTSTHQYNRFIIIFTISNVIPTTQQIFPKVYFEQDNSK